MIVRSFRNIKEHWRAILVTQNADIAVLADADLERCLKASSEGR